MRKVQFDEILAPELYERRRDELRALVLEVKRRRRVHLGTNLTFLFENAATMRYQVQEMLRAEKRSDPRDVAHELATYNELLGGAGELGCTLLIEIEDPAQRDQLLEQWWELPVHLFARFADGQRTRALFDERQRGRGRLSAVQYLRFACPKDASGRWCAPVALGTDLPGLEFETGLAPEQQRALLEDLQS